MMGTNPLRKSQYTLVTCTDIRAAISCRCLQATIADLRASCNACAPADAAAFPQPFALPVILVQVQQLRMQQNRKYPVVVSAAAVITTKPYCWPTIACRQLLLPWGLC